MKFQKHFTLIELLVVVAIIGILLSLLLPSLTKAREATKVAVCMSNNHQIGASLILGTNDFNDHFVPALDESQVSWVSRVEGIFKGTEPVSNYTFRQENSDPNRNWYCPTFVLESNLYGVAGWVHYGYNNSSEVGGAGSGRKDDDGNKTSGKSGGLVTKLDSPTDTLMIGDSMHWAGDRGIWEMHFGSYQFRHHFGKSMNFLFVDGHIENLKKPSIQHQLGKLLDGTWR